MICPVCSKDPCIWVKTIYREDGTKFEGCRYCWEEKVNYNEYVPQTEPDGSQDFKISPAHRRHIQTRYINPDGSVTSAGRVTIGWRG